MLYMSIKQIKAGKSVPKVAVYKVYLLHAVDI